MTSSGRDTRVIVRPSDHIGRRGVVAAYYISS